jgi:hypothetical protein
VSPRHTKVTEPSTRSPRTAWRRPRSTLDVIDILERNAFVPSNTTVGVAYVRVSGIFAIRVTIANGAATLETAQRVDGQSVKWRPCQGIGTAPWQVAGEALEYLATVSVDTPVRWG